MIPRLVKGSGFRLREISGRQMGSSNGNVNGKDKQIRLTKC